MTLLIAAGVCTWGGYWLVATNAYSFIRAKASSTPLLECPSDLVVSASEGETHAEFRFQMANRGGGPLTISRIETNCACLGPVRIDGDARARVSAMTMLPGERVDMSVRARLSLTANGSFRNHVTLHTNDPQRPTHTIIAVVTGLRGGVFATPAAADFGSVKVGKRATKVINVWNCPAGLTFEKVATSNPAIATGRITWNPAAGGALADKDNLVKCRVRAGGEHATLEIRVRCNKEV